MARIEFWNTMEQLVSEDQLIEMKRDPGILFVVQLGLLRNRSMVEIAMEVCGELWRRLHEQRRVVKV